MSRPVGACDGFVATSFPGLRPSLWNRAPSGLDAGQRPAAHENRQIGLCEGRRRKQSRVRSPLCRRSGRTAILEETSIFVPTAMRVFCGFSNSMLARSGEGNRLVHANHREIRGVCRGRGNATLLIRHQMATILNFSRSNRPKLEAPVTSNWRSQGA
jgi:hypothetical protein